MTPATEKKSLFVMEDGTNLMFTFILVSSLFLLWGFCNGMIDVMDKHFQDELGLTKSQSAWVQFAHYLGYFLMSMPAGWLATQAGLQGRHHHRAADGRRGRTLVHSGHHIQEAARPDTLAQHRVLGFLVGVCVIATRADVSGNDRQSLHDRAWAIRSYAATRINLAQSANGIGWIFGPIIGGMFFYSKDAAGRQHGQPDALDSLRRHRRRRHRSRRHFLLCQRSRHQDRGRLPPGRQRRRQGTVPRRQLNRPLHLRPAAA